MNTKRNTIISTVLILAFLAIAFLVVNKNSFIIGFDQSIQTFISNHQFSPVSNIMLSITKIGDVYESLAIFVVFALFLFLKNKKSLYIFIISTFLGVTSSWIIKYLVNRGRPSNLLLDPSFPSAHATIAIIFLLSSLILLTPQIKNNFAKYTFITVASIIFPLIAISRIYLSVHWTTDVIAGIILGFICYMFSGFISCQKKKNML